MGDWHGPKGSLMSALRFRSSARFTETDLTPNLAIPNRLPSCHRLAFRTAGERHRQGASAVLPGLIRALPMRRGIAAASENPLAAEPGHILRQRVD